MKIENLNSHTIMKKNNKPLKIIALSMFVIGVALLFAVAVFTSCKKDYEEVNFSGTVVGCTMCNTKTMGYVIELSSPEHYGKELAFEGETYHNAVVAYESPKQLRDEQKVSGVMYKTEGYGAINCTMLYDYNSNNVQEVILLDID